MSKPRTIEKILDYENPWIKLYFDKVQFPSGTVGRFTRIVEGVGLPGVVILPIKKSVESLEIGLVRQFRYPVEEEMWEVPRGFGDEQDPKKDVIRELGEETGIEVSAKDIVYLGDVFPNSGLLASHVLYFLVDCSNPIVVNPIESNDEVKEFKWFDAKIVFDWIRSNHIKDGFTICAIMLSLTAGVISINGIESSG